MIDEILSLEERYLAPSSWWEHIPTALANSKTKAEKSRRAWKSLWSIILWVLRSSRVILSRNICIRNRHVDWG